MYLCHFWNHKHILLKAVSEVNPSTAKDYVNDLVSVTAEHDAKNRILATPYQS